MSSEHHDSSAFHCRRVVTGNDTNGKSKVLYDDEHGSIQFLGGSKFQTVWFTDDAPVDCSSATDKDPTGNKTFAQVNESGTVCTMVWMKPGGASPVHSTKSIDYAVILEGEIELELTNGEKTTLKAGDVIVQREVLHAWRNPSPTNWVKFFCVLIASKH